MARRIRLSTLLGRSDPDRHAHPLDLSGAAVTRIRLRPETSSAGFGPAAPPGAGSGKGVQGAAARHEHASSALQVLPGDSGVSCVQTDRTASVGGSAIRDVPRSGSVPRTGATDSSGGANRCAAGVERTDFAVTVLAEPTAVGTAARRVAVVGSARGGNQHRTGNRPIRPESRCVRDRPRGRGTTTRKRLIPVRRTLGVALGG